MKNSRREFLRTGTLVGLSAAVSLSFADLTFAQDYFGKFDQSGFRMPDEALLNPVSRMKLEEFSDFLNQSFTISHQTRGNLELTLIDVIANQPADGKAKKRQKVAASGECFSLVFSGATTFSLRQGSYTFTHEKLGVFELFLVPGTRNRSARHYEALFNRL